MPTPRSSQPRAAADTIEAMNSISLIKSQPKTDEARSCRARGSHVAERLFAYQADRTDVVKSIESIIAQIDAKLTER